MNHARLRSANYKCWRHARYKSGFTQRTFDLAVIATGHVWPDEEEATERIFPARGQA